jgi:hypothetical protein
MALHLLKLSVGAESFADHAAWLKEHIAQLRKAGKPAQAVHTTRMVPKRIDELLDGGSLYWVIKGVLCARQKLLAIEPFTDSEGISRCHLVLDGTLVPVAPRPKRPFQGWRYLQAKDAPPDLRTGAPGTPPDLARELAELGLL